VALWRGGWVANKPLEVDLVSQLCVLHALYDSTITDTGLYINRAP
jgi:hypothetical protein